MTLNKTSMILLFIAGALLSTACSDDKIDSKSPTPQQIKIDSLSSVKENKAAESAKLKHQLDSLKRHLDSIKNTSANSIK